MLKHASPPAPFADITPLLAHFPAAPDVVTADALTAHLDRYSVKAGPLLPLLVHLQRFQRSMPVLHHPRLCVFASHYPNPAQAATHTNNTINALQHDSHPLKQLAASLNADLRVYELDLAQTSRNAAQAAQAMTYGMLAIEEKGDAIVIASLSEGAEQAAASLTVPHTEHADDLLTTLVLHTGLDFFAALGACLAARLAGQPVLVCGVFGQKLIAVLKALEPTAADHVYLCGDNDVMQTMLPVFTAVQNLQQISFLLSFLPTPLKTLHITGSATRPT